VTNKPLSEERDEALVRLTLDHGSQFFGNLVKRHADYIYGLGMRLTGGNHALAHDVSQQTFIKAFKYLASFNPNHQGLGQDAQHRFRNWLTGIAINCHTDLSVSERKYIALEEKDLSALESAQTKRSLNPDLSEFEAMIDPLNSMERQLIILRYVYEFTVDEISGMLQLKSGTTKSKLSRTVAKLRALQTQENTEVQR